MLYKIENKIPVVWRGELLNKVRHPLNIEQLWSTSDLENVGLYRAASADPVPAGMRMTGTTVAMVGGIVKLVNTLVPITPADMEYEIRSTRNRLIAASDWTQLPDAPLSAAQVSAWLLYRQQLLDVTKEAGFPANVIWPIAPA